MAVWDSVGSLAVAGLLGIVAVVLIQRNRKWLIGKSMPAESEALLVEYLKRQSVVRAVTNVRSEEIGLRQYRCGGGCSVRFGVWFWLRGWSGVGCCFSPCLRRCPVWPVSINHPSRCSKPNKIGKIHRTTPKNQRPTRHHRFQADVAFDGAELARRCLDRVGRQRLFQALAAASSRRDAAHMDALLMQVRCRLCSGCCDAMPAGLVGR